MSTERMDRHKSPADAVYDIRQPKFWERESLDSEFARIFDICHQCRRCFDVCPSFDVMFKTIDRGGEDASVLTASDNKRVLDLCYQCKLCYNHCPYTPPHQWALDFPRLMLRVKAVEVKERGSVTLQDKALGKTDSIGRTGSRFAPIANMANRNSLGRLLMEKVLGVHRDRNLLDFHRQTFSKWFKKRPVKAASSRPENGEVAIFHTCTVEYNGPQLGRAAVEVLEHNKLGVSCPEQRCCGMPFLDGDIESTIESPAFNVKQLAEEIRAGRDVVVPGPTCSCMLKKEYPELLGTEDSRLVGERTYDLCKYLVKKAQEGKLSRASRKSPARLPIRLPATCAPRTSGSSLAT